jgi:V/A-type H+-transporting ATPase subunit F
VDRYGFKVVTRPGRGLGFRLAGAQVEEVAPGEVAERCRALLADRGLGVVAMDEELLGELPESVLERTGREGIPVLLPFAFPARWAEGGRGEEYVAALIRRAIGYHVKIRR